MPQNDYIDEHRKRHGYRFDHFERIRKREARLVHKRAEFAQKVHGMRAKLFHQKRHQEKVDMKKKISQHQERKNKHEEKPTDTTAKPSFLLERSRAEAAKVLSNSLKQKRKEKAGKWNVPLPKVRGLSEAEVFRPITTGKKRGKQWKRLITKPTFVGDSFTRKPPKYERFIRPMGLRFKRAHVTHPELKTTFYLDILGVKKNPSSPLFTQLGVLSKGTILEVNVSDLGLVTQSGKVVWGKYAQITNNPENDGCVNALLLV